MSDDLRPIRDPFESAITERLARAQEMRRFAAEAKNGQWEAQMTAVTGELLAILNDVTYRVHGFGAWKPSDKCDTTPPRAFAGPWERENSPVAARIWFRLLGNFYQYEYLIQQAQSYCESPIEEAMAAAIMTDPGFFQEGPPILIAPGTYWEPPQRPDPTLERLYIAPQFPVAGYRVDLAVAFARTGLCVAVECDGHEFHDKTKEQAARDKARDRALLAAGWPVMRFTGSEIHADAFACAQQVSNVLTGMAPAEHAELLKAARRAAE